jgi:hypothetical protein
LVDWIVELDVAADAFFIYHLESFLADPANAFGNKLHDIVPVE